MGRLLKILLYVVTGFVALVLIAAVTLVLVFDQNDFRENISVAVQENTGRELTIDGDLDLSLFPWLAIEIGTTRLGNAAGFGDDPFASFERARLSVRVLPLLLRREVAIGTAEIDSLQLNLEVRRDGRSNWQDFLELGDAAASAPEASSGEPSRLDIASINIQNSSVSYSDEQSGDRYALTDFNLTSGAVTNDEPVHLQGDFGFDLQPAGITGTIEMETMLAFDVAAGIINLDDFVIGGLIEGVAETPTILRLDIPTLEANTVDEVLTPGDIELSIAGVELTASVEPFSYAGDPQPVAMIQVDSFSPRSLMQRLDIEAPETADPHVLGEVSIEAKATVSDNAVGLTNLKLVLDDTIFTGELYRLPAVPRSSTGRYRLNLAADSIDLNRYMAPADDGANADSVVAEAPVEIPADLIRPLNVRGSLKIEEAYLGGLKFETVILEMNTANGDMRIHPISAALYDGEYSGDVRINVAGNTPVISVDEKIQRVLLAPLALAMFEQENITGSINGAFRLSGSGQDLGEVQRSLNGAMSVELLDGTWEGTDVWYELRSARARLKQEPAPEPELPSRTKFSSVKATGVVTDGVFNNNDLLAELPFMRITGKGSVDLAEANIDYHMTARVFERPEFVQGATDEELDEFTEAVIPLRITGPMSSPSIKPDIEGMLKKELMDKLFGSRDKSKTEETGAGVADAPASDAAEEPAEEEDLEDLAKKALLDLLEN